MEVADCVGVEPSVRLVGPSVSSYLGQPDSHVTEAKAHTHADTHKHTHKNMHTLYLDLLCLTGTIRQRKQPDGGMQHTLSVSLREGLAAAH